MKPNDSLHTIGPGVRIGYVHLRVVNLDHGVSEAHFLRDPDDNGVELY